MRALPLSSIVPAPSIISLMSHPFATPRALLLAAALLSGCAAIHSHKDKAAPAPQHPDASALTVMAEADLKRGDCRGASENYAQAASVGDAKLAQRATQVAMACEHLPAAWQSATRWRTLAPNDREANALYAAVALKLYRTTDARAAIHDFWRLEEQQDATAAQSPALPGKGPITVPPVKREERAAKSMTELTALLLEESDASATLTAMSGALEPGANTPETQILLGELALAAYDGQRAQTYAQRALQHDPEDAAALRVLARAYVMRGEGSQALVTARRAAADDAKAGGFELAEIYASLDRSEEAHQELEGLRGKGAPQAEIDRRL